MVVGPNLSSYQLCPAAEERWQRQRGAAIVDDARSTVMRSSCCRSARYSSSNPLMASSSICRQTAKFMLLSTHVFMFIFLVYVNSDTIINELSATYTSVSQLLLLDKN